MRKGLFSMRKNANIGMMMVMDMSMAMLMHLSVLTSEKIA